MSSSGVSITFDHSCRRAPENGSAGFPLSEKPFLEWQHFLRGNDMYLDVGGQCFLSLVWKGICSGNTIVISSGSA